MTLLSLSTMVSMLFMFSKTPLMMALLIVAQTTMVTLSIYTFLSTSWLSFILFMIIVSAMMVIFAYVSSLASNDFIVMPHYAPNPIIYFTLLSLISAYFMLTPQNTPSKSQINMSDTDLTPAMSYKLYSIGASYLTMFLIIYLLIGLIVVAKISMSSKGALRAVHP